ncbi:MAG: choice-of-anchor D domain-containing protein, partial [Gemmatimonadetes bacterium]|nr:choice-of-anchor D domain-containing protein [Gemmatimonadota bacterium]
MTSPPPKLDATELIGGDYDAEISVTSNDPDEPLIVVPAHLHVTGIPDIALSDDTLNYGSLFIGLSAENTLTVSNMGTDVLTVSNVSSSHPDYVADTAGGFSLAVAESRDIVVTFTPSASGPLPATLTLVSDDPDEGSVDVTLSGEGVLPPDVDVSPTLLTEDLFTDEMSTQTLSIANTAIGADLSWAIDV